MWVFLTRFSHLSQAFSVLGVFRCAPHSAVYPRFPSSIIQCSFMSPMPTDPQGLSRDTPFLTEAFEYKVNGAVHNGLQKESLTEMTSNNCTSTYRCQLSLLLQVQLILSGSAQPLNSASHVPSTSLASLLERKASTKCPLFILWFRSTLHQLLRFSSLLITTFNPTHRFSSYSGDAKVHLALFKSDIYQTGS